MKNVAIIILNWNGKENTLACLSSVSKLQITNYKLQIIVVDNGSTERLRIKDEGLRIIRNKENLGYAGGNNAGIKFALAKGSDYIVILNNDTIVDKDLVVELVRTAESDVKIGIVAPKIYFEKGYEFHKDRYRKEDLGKVIWYAGGVMDWENVLGHHRGVDEVDEGQYDNKEETDYASGCAMLVKKEAFDAVGLLDEKYFLYYEDSDLCERAKQKDFKIVYTPDAVLWHKNAGSAGGSGSHLQDYYITRNRLLFGMRYAPLKSKIALLRESVAFLLVGREWQKRGVIDFYAGKFGKGSFSIHD